MGAQIVMWLIAVVAVIAINSGNPRDADARGLSLMLATTWGVSNILVGLYGLPDGARLFPLIDLVAGLAVLLVWRRRPAVWKLALLSLFVLQMLGHTAFWGALWLGRLPNSFATALMQYIVALNAMFACQLVCVAFPGGRYVGDRVRTWMRRRARLGRLAGH